MKYVTWVKIVACKVWCMKHERKWLHVKYEVCNMWKWLHAKYEIWNISESGWIKSMMCETYVKVVA